MATEPLIVELDARTRKLDAKLKATDKRLDELDKSAVKAGLSLKQMTAIAITGATLAAAAITSMAKSAALFAKEIQIAAQRNKESVEEMQALAFASNTVGISLEKLGDIGKDSNEKIGEFLATGGGGFQDFADVMRLTSSEARDMAKEFSLLSGTDVLQEMTKRMEEAGISSNQVSFALEGLASDATDLIPLFTKNADELNRLRREFEELGTTLSQEQIDRLKQVGEEFSKLSATFGAEGRQLIADYSEELINAINLIETLGIKTIAGLNLIATGWGNIIEIAQAALTDLVNDTDTLAETVEERAQITQEFIDKLMGESSKVLEITVRGGTEIIKQGTSEEKASLNQRLINFRTYTQAAQAINAGFLEDNKAIKAGLIVADTAAAVMMQMSSGDPYTAFARAALAAATGAVQLANALSSSPGGGSVSGGGATATATSPEPDFQQETATQQLSVTNIGDETSTGLGTVEFIADGGSASDEIFADMINQMSKSGRLKTRSNT